MRSSHSDRIRDLEGRTAAHAWRIFPIVSYGRATGSPEATALLMERLITIRVNFRPLGTPLVPQHPEGQRLPIRGDAQERVDLKRKKGWLRG